MILELGIYRLDIDADRTKMFYAVPRDLGCGCDGCRNFERALPALPAEVRDFLRQLGIDPGQPAEVSAVHSPEGTDTLYSGFYHICGTILEGRNPWVQTGLRQYRLDERYAIEFPGDFSFFFTSDCHLLAPEFPRPAIQLEFSGMLPWVLDVPNPYI